MDDDSRVETCRWSRLTLYMPYPVWLESEESPWTCLRDPVPHPLEEDRICHGCPRWEPRRLHVTDFPR